MKNITFALALLLIVSITTQLVSAQATTTAPQSNNSCVFQIRLKSPDEEWSKKWPQAPLSLSALYNALLPASSYPTLNASIMRQFDDLSFNITRVTNRNSNNASSSASSSSLPNVDPYVGCQAMLNNLNDTLREQYNIKKAWIGFVPVHVPAYLRHLTQQPKALYVALGATGAVLVVVQVGYGLWHSYVNRGTLESVSND